MKKYLLISTLVFSSIVLLFTVSCGKKSGEEGKVYFSTIQSDSNAIINDVREFWISDIKRTDFGAE